jgi:hypothetical protein
MPLSSDSPHSDEEVMRAFAAASDLDLSLEDPIKVFGQPVGALVSCLVGQPIVHVTPAEHPPQPPSDDAVRQVVVAWESFDPDEILETWDRHVAPPVAMVLTADLICAVDRKMIEEGIKTDEYRRRREEYPSFSPRKVKIENLKIVYMGAAQAVATYRFEESFQNNTVVATNALAILMMNQQNDWKIALYSKHI